MINSPQRGAGVMDYGGAWQALGESNPSSQNENLVS